MSPTSAAQLEITLPHPDGSSPGLDAIIDAVEEYIQRSVLLLASGDPGSQPDFVEWLEKKGLLSDEGLDAPEDKSVLVDSYSDRRKEVETRVSELERENQNIDSSKFAAFDTSNKTYQNVRTIERELKNTLTSAPAPASGDDGIYRLSAAAEIGLIHALLNSVDRVHDEVDRAADDIDRRAREIDGSVPTVPSSHRNGGGVVPVSTPFRQTASDAGYEDSDHDDPVGDALDRARSQIGVSEFDEAFDSKPYDNDSAWCAAFTSWLWDEAGYKVNWTDYDYVPAVWNDALTMNLDATAGQAQPGDLIVFDWKGDGNPDHIGIVESVRDGRIHTIEGNSSDKVQRQNYAIGAGQIFGIVKAPSAERSVEA
ncbi:C40 family peptidase [Nocardia sp. NBC_00416]|uniref:C40 family peptidase n=1 Tax=Nocardia sp. NBC_00416 TaxID=2975991 RepID=UPI002E1EA5A6